MEAATNNDNENNKKQKAVYDDAPTVETSAPKEPIRKRRLNKHIKNHCIRLRNNTVTELNRGFTEDEAKAIGQALVGNTSLDHLVLYLNELPLPGVQALCDGILQSQIKHLTTSGIGVEDSSVCLCCVFRTVEVLPTITKLRVQSPLDVDAINSLGQALKNNANIKELEITDQLEDLTCDKAKALLLALQQSHIVKLEIGCQFYGYSAVPLPTNQVADTATALAILFEAIQQKMQSLEVLTVTNYTAYLPLITRLADGLQRSTTLKELVLQEAELLDVETMRVLSQGLSQCSSLTTLRLLDSNLEDDSVQVLAKHLNQTSRLETLDFGSAGDARIYNNIGSSGALALVRAVANMPAMQSLNLDGNIRIGYTGLRQIGEELPNLHLREVILMYYQDFEDEDLEENELEALRQAASNALLQGIRNNESMQHLYISDAMFHDEFFSKLNYYLALNRLGRRMVTMDHGLSSTIWCYVVARAERLMEKDDEVYPEHFLSFIYYVLKEQPHLVQVSW